LLEQGIERALLSDFGLARAADDASLTHTGYLPGTPHYMSPEQARGDAIDTRSDLFSLGSVLYAMCTGRPPFRADTSFGVLRRITDTQPRPIREVNADIPVWLAAMTDKLLAKQPADRFGSAAELAQLLEQCLAHVQQPATVPLPVACRGGKAGSSSHRPSKLITVIAIAALTIASVIAFSMFHRPTSPDGSDLSTAEALTSDVSPSTLDWNAAADEISSLSNDVAGAEQKIDLLWDSQPATATPEEPTPEPTP